VLWLDHAYGVSINGKEDFGANRNIINDQLDCRFGMLTRDLSVHGKLMQEHFITNLNNTNSDTFAANYRI